MNSTAVKPMFLHVALVAIGLIASTFGNHFGNQLDSQDVRGESAGNSAAEEKVRGEVSSPSVSPIQANRASDTARNERGVIGTDSKPADTTADSVGGRKS